MRGALKALRVCVCVCFVVFFSVYFLFLLYACLYMFVCLRAMFSITENEKKMTMFIGNGVVMMVRL